MNPTSKSFRCLCIDGVCRQEIAAGAGLPSAARPDAGPAPARPLAISASVGLGGFNRPDDVKNIQRALNHLIPDVGGAVPFLVDDGLVGPKTTAAIERFQRVNFGWADSRVDPAKKTITRMEELLTLQPGNPYGGDPKKRVAFAISRLRSASLCIQSAETNISRVLPFVRNNTKPGGLLGPLFADRMELLERHFKISEFGANAANELTRLRDTYLDMRSVITQSVPASPNLDNFFSEFLGGSAFAFDPHEEQLKPTTLAYTVLAGWRKKGETAGTPPRPSDRIYLRALLDRCSEDMFVEIIIHELAHFTSPLATPIEDHAYGWINDPRMTVLKARKRVQNAQNFATYAVESRFGRRNGRLPI